jgi:hypothetical protein
VDDGVAVVEAVGEQVVDVALGVAGGCVGRTAFRIHVGHVGCSLRTEWGAAQARKCNTQDVVLTRRGSDWLAGGMGREVVRTRAGATVRLVYIGGAKRAREQEVSRAIRAKGAAQRERRAPGSSEP